MHDSRGNPNGWTCIDRVVPREAYRVNRAGIRGEIDPSMIRKAPPDQPRMASAKAKRWPKTTISCTFLDGSELFCQRVCEIAKEWEQHCAIIFDFGDSRKSDVRISFRADNGCWSAVGIDALERSYFPLHQPTMNLGWLSSDVPELEWRRVVLHEFGHVLGCVHEHSSPALGRPWNEDEVFKVFGGPPNFWSDDEIQHNILAKYRADEIDATSFDEDSIMLYSFAANLFADDAGATSLNSELSTLDKQMIGQIYPKMR